MPNTISAKFCTYFKQLNALINRLHDSLVPPNQISHPTPAMTQTLIVAHSIAHATTVWLHSLFMHTDATAKCKQLAATQSGMH
jgi:hypothetical protein